MKGASSMRTLPMIVSRTIYNQKGLLCRGITLGCLRQTHWNILRFLRYTLALRRQGSTSLWQAHWNILRFLRCIPPLYHGRACGFPSELKNDWSNTSPRPALTPYLAQELLHEGRIFYAHPTYDSFEDDLKSERPVAKWHHTWLFKSSRPEHPTVLTVHPSP